MRYPVRLFGPGLPPAGQDAELSVESGRLSLVTPAVELPLHALQLRRCGFDERGIELAWEQDGAWALQLLDAASAETLLTTLPPALAAQRATLGARQRRNALGRRVVWSSIALWMAAPALLLLGLFVFSDPLAGWVADRIPLTMERELGESAFESMRAQMQLRDDSEAARAVRVIGERLVKGSRYRYEFHLVEDPAVNAFALPGGIVVVNTGLLRASHRAEEVAGVLAHEVQHVERRHGLKGIVKQLGLSLVWTLVTGDVGSGAAGEIARNMLGLKFSRDAEREADEAGFQTLLRAGIDPSGMAEFFRVLEKTAQTAGAPPAILSTHPDSAERRAHLDDLVAQHRQASFTPLPYSPWPPRMD